MKRVFKVSLVCHCNPFEKLRTLGWHIGELEEQLRKKRIATQEPTPASNDSNMS